MARLSDLKLRYRLFMKAYSYRKHDWRPGSRLGVPLSDARVSVVTTAALYGPDQEAFDESIKGGDVSYRILPTETDLSTLEIAHRSEAFDHTGIERDKNLALPLDRLKELVADGALGSLGPRHFSFMGSITAPGRLVSKTAPEVAAKLKDDDVDGVLLIPV